MFWSENNSAVSPVGHRNCHSQPGKTRQSSAAILTLQAALLMPISGPMNSVVV